MPLSPGDKIDRYTILDRLGEGGMGVVFRAHDPRLERSVALKLLVEGTGTDASGEGSGGHARMLREARSAAALEHPNVVAVYDVAEAESPEALRGTTYLAMELIEGRSLRDYVGDPSIAIEQRVAWLASVARALQAAHARGLVHRDVKPGNVMIRSDGLVKVLDFGIAKRYGAAVDPNAATAWTGATTTGGTAVRGTPAYMAPEQLRKDPIDGRCDQFAWGVMAYELLGGKRPWRSEDDAMHLVAEILAFEPPALSAIAADVPEHVSRAVMRALAKSPDARFADMGELLDALEGRAKERSGANAAPAPRGAPRAHEPASRSASAVHVPAPPPQPPKRRAPAIVAAAVAAAAIAAAFLVARARGSSATSASVADAAPARECASNAACLDAHHGEAWTCRRGDGRCVALAAPGCEVIADSIDLRDDATVWLGVIAPKWSLVRNAADLARRDFASVPRALLTGGHRRRPIGLVSCVADDVDRAAAAHLVDDVGAPAILGFSGSEQSMSLLSEVVVPHRVLAMITEGTAAQLTSIPSPPGEPRLVWRTTHDTTQIARAVSSLVALLESRRGAARSPFGVALVRPATISGTDFSDAIVSTLRLHGGSVAENQSSFAEQVLAVTVGPDDPAIARARDAILRQQPGVVIYYGAELLDWIVRPVDAAWPGARPRPYYVSGLPLDDEGLRSVAGDGAGLRRRLFAVTTPANTAANAKFTLHYNASFDDKVTPDYAPNTTYDAFYALAYALHALGDGAVDGPALARAFDRLRSGPAIEVGPAKILDALGALGNGGSIDLVGSAGDLALDPKTGESPTDEVVLCVSSTNPPTPVESGLVWRASSGALAGALRCP